MWWILYIPAPKSATNTNKNLFILVVLVFNKFNALKSDCVGVNALKYS